MGPPLYAPAVGGLSSSAARSESHSPCQTESFSTLPGWRHLPPASQPRWAACRRCAATSINAGPVLCWRSTSDGVRRPPPPTTHAPAHHPRGAWRRSKYQGAAQCRAQQRRGSLVLHGRHRQPVRPVVGSSLLAADPRPAAARHTRPASGSRRWRTESTTSARRQASPSSSHGTGTARWSALAAGRCARASGTTARRRANLSTSRRRRASRRYCQRRRPNRRRRSRSSSSSSTSTSVRRAARTACSRARAAARRRAA